MPQRCSLDLTMVSRKHRLWGLYISHTSKVMSLTFQRWSSYNHYSCSPNETTIRSNAKALVDLGLDALGYRYVGIDCGWTVADRLSNGSLTWNETLFPSGFPALGKYIHDLGLLFGVYEDAGIKTCNTGIDQAGSLCKL